MTQSIITTPKEYHNVPQLVEDIWFNIDSPNHQNKRDPFQEANNRYAEQLLGIQRKQVIREERHTQDIPIVDNIPVGEDFYDPDRRSPSSTPGFATPPLYNGPNQVSYRNRVRIHTLASLSLTPGQIGGQVHRSHPTIVCILN